MTYSKAYYLGGCRVVVEGVPIRLARKPSEHNLKWSRAWTAYLEKPEYYSPADRRANVVRDAKAAIHAYALALGITDAAAKKKIAAHATHRLANPLVDLSQEYDL